MLNNEINELREKLDNAILKNEDYSIIYQLSIELDELIAQYYAKNNKKVVIILPDSGERYLSTELYK